MLRKIYPRAHARVSSLPLRADFTGVKDCVAPGSLPQDRYCDFAGNGAQACESGICSPVDIGLTELGSCGECESDLDCLGNQSCVDGVLVLELGELSDSHCQ